MRRRISSLGKCVGSLLRASGKIPGRRYSSSYARTRSCGWTPSTISARASQASAPLAAHWQTHENRPSGSAPHASPCGHAPPHVGWALLMHGVEPAGTQPHVALSVLSLIRSVEQTPPSGQAPPRRAGEHGATRIGARRRDRRETRARL